MFGTPMEIVGSSQVLLEVRADDGRMLAEDC